MSAPADQGLVRDLTDQECAELLDLSRRDVGWWAQEFLGVQLWAPQIQALHSWRDHRETSWSSCNGIGKTYADAVGVLWLGSCWPETTILTTATTMTQARGSLWYEIGKLIAGARRPLGCLDLTTSIKWPHGSRAITVTAPAGGGRHTNKMQGYRGGRTFALGDEANGLEASILEAVNSILTGEGGHLMLTGNPLESGTPFAETFDQPDVEKIETSAFETPNFTAFGVELEDLVSGTWRQKIGGRPLPAPKLITPEWADQLLTKCARNIENPIFVARVRGRFPGSATDTLIPRLWVDAAYEIAKRNRAEWATKPVELAVDVARFGDDESVIAMRRGIWARITDVCQGFDTQEVADLAIRRYRLSGARVVRVDAVGVGGGVADAGRKAGHPFVDVVVNETASNPQDFVSLRDEGWWDLRTRFEHTYRALHREVDQDGQPFYPGIILDGQVDKTLIEDLTAPRYKLPNGRVRIEAKDLTKKRLRGRSPDRGDALMMVFLRDPKAEAKEEALRRDRAMAS